MLKYRRIIQESARRIAVAANRGVVDYIGDEIGQNPEFTIAMVARMKQAMDGYKTRDVQWAAKTVTNKAQNTQTGIDFLGMVEFELPECRIKQCFLAQVTHVERGQTIAPRDWDAMADQCRKMLAITAESFVFVYAHSGIVVVPALAIVSASGPLNPHDAYSRTALRFYQDHFECFVGDAKIAAADAVSSERIKARHTLHLSAAQIQPPVLQMKLGAF